MKKNLKIIWLFSKFSVKTSLSNRAGVVLFLTGKIIRFVLFFLFIYRLLNQSGSLAGFNLAETFVFFLSFNLLDSLVQMLFREVYRFRPLIVSGEFDSVLVKPYHPFLKILLGGIDVLDIVPTIAYALFLVYFSFQASVTNLAHILLYTILFFNGILIAAGFHIIVLSLGIFTTQVDHTIMIYRDMSRMASLPIDIYQEPLRSVLLYVIPIGIMVSVPAQVLVGTFTPGLVMYALVFSGVFFVFSLYLWRQALKKYQSWGG